MKRLLFLVMYIFLNFTFGQETFYTKIDNSCEAGIKEANEDIQNNQFKYLSYGLIGYTDLNYTNFHNQFVFEKYNVILGEGGCVVSKRTDCYRETMEKFILKKYGEDFFKRIFLESEKAYPESDYFKEKILPEIESGNFVISQFSSNDSLMTKFINQNIDLSQLEKSSTINLSYILERNGKLSNIEVKNTNNPILADLIVQTLEKYPIQTPFRYFGYDVKVHKKVNLEFASITP